MKIVSSKHFGPVEAIRLGFGPVGPPLMTVIVYRLGDTIVDAGQRHMVKPLLALLEKKPPRRILLTHHHEDHSGNAAIISNRFRAEVLGHRLTAAKLRARFPIRLYQHYLWGKSEPVTVSPLPPVVETGGFRFRPIHTPGHSKDHTAYLEENNGWLFSGDVYLGDRIKFFRADEHFAPQIDSIKALLSLDFDALFCAHNPAPTGGRDRLVCKLAFLEELYGRIGDLRARGFSSRAIIHRLDPGLDRTVRFITMGNVSFANMVRSALETLSLQESAGFN